MLNFSVSIVVINLNNEAGLERTILSAINQDYLTKEIIVIDGKSSDGSSNVISKYEGEINYWCSEHDAGIYDAMNKGITRSQNQWLIFMNSGDIFPSKNVLASINYDCECDVIYGNKVKGNAIEEPFDLCRIKYGEIFACHQSMFFFRDCLVGKNNGYDTAYNINGDLELCARLLVEKKKFKYQDITVSKTEEGGISQSLSWRKRLEWIKVVFKYFGFIQLIRTFQYRVARKIGLST